MDRDDHRYDVTLCPCTLYVIMLSLFVPEMVVMDHEWQICCARKQSCLTQET